MHDLLTYSDMLIAPCSVQLFGPESVGRSRRAGNEICERCQVRPRVRSGSRCLAQLNRSQASPVAELDYTSNCLDKTLGQLVLMEEGKKP